jgi:hypothetical protein
MVMTKTILTSCSTASTPLMTFACLRVSMLSQIDSHGSEQALAMLYRLHLPGLLAEHQGQPLL